MKNKSKFLLNMIFTPAARVLVFMEATVFGHMVVEVVFFSFLNLSPH